MKSNFNRSRHIYRTDIRTFFSRIDIGIQTSFCLNCSLDIRISLCGFRNGLDVGKSRSSRSRDHYDVDLASDFFFLHRYSAVDGGCGSRNLAGRDSLCSESALTY